MLALNDGRSELYQWDTGRKLSVDAECSQVHFSNKILGRSVDVDVVDGVAIIPDILLQTDKDLAAWAFVGSAENGYTKISKVFKVNRRNKPSDYVFTAPEQTTLEEIKDRLDYLESIQDHGATKDAVKYVEQTLTEEQQRQARKNITAVGGVYKTGKNKIDETKVVEGETPSSNGTIVALSNMKRTDYIWLEPGTYSYSNKEKIYSQFRYAIYNEHKEFVKIVLKETVITITTPCYIMIADGKVRNYLQLEVGSVATEYEPYTEGDVFYDVSGQVASGHFEGKTILFDGDSITAGDGFTNDEKTSIIYPAIVAKTLGMKLVNHAIGGSTAASKNPESDNTKQPLVLRFQDYTEYADIVYIAIGTNDWSYAYTEIGTMEDREDVLNEDGTNKATPYTFYGALHMICRGLLNKYPGKPIIFATPIKRRYLEEDKNPNARLRNGKTLKEYGEIIKEVCDWYSIPVIDMYSECNITPFIDEQRNAFFQETKGGTHPNAAGQAVMARRVIAGIRSIVGI